MTVLDFQAALVARRLDEDRCLHCGRPLRRPADGALWCAACTAALSLRWRGREAGRRPGQARRKLARK